MPGSCPGCIADLEKSFHRQVWKHPDLDGAFYADIGSESAGDDHPFNVVVCDSRLRKQRFNPCPDRSFCQLNFVYIFSADQDIMVISGIRFVVPVNISSDC